MPADGMIETVTDVQQTQHNDDIGHEDDFMSKVKQMFGEDVAKKMKGKLFP